MAPSFRAMVKDYCTNCTFAGVHFIAEDERHWTERYFWLVMVIFSWYGSALLIIASWDSFQNNSISFGVETTYKDWNTYFPSIAVCENDNLERMYQVSDEIWTVDHAVDLEEVLRELAYFRGISYYTLQFCNKPGADPLCPTTNLSFYANEVRSNCLQSIGNCSYNGDSFKCCEYFEAIDTDVGKCYIMNSIQSNNPDAKRYPMINNIKLGLGVFKMDVLIPAKVYTIGEEEVPALTTLQSEYFAVVVGIYYRRQIAVRNIENDPLTRETSVEQRNCRYPDELASSGLCEELGCGRVYRCHSYSACTVDCRRNAQLRLCNCTDHFMPRTPEHLRCNMSGLVCLNTYYSDLSVMRPEWAQRRGLVCDCLPSCNEAEITVIKDYKKGHHKNSAAVEISLQYLPTERFKRNVVRSRLDLVVSVGGTTGLFVGASLLSFVELIFFFTVRYYGNYYKERTSVMKNSAQNKEFDLDYSMIGRKKSVITGPTISYVNDIPFVEVRRTRFPLSVVNHF